MNMKKILCLFAAIMLAMTAFVAGAETPEEIVSRMEAAINSRAEDGIAMTIRVKVPIVGEMCTKTYSRGKKSLTKSNVKGVDCFVWTDGGQIWTYNNKTNEIYYAKSSSSPDNDNMALFDGIADGYDLCLVEEDEKSWTLKGSKMKSNEDDEAPKKLEIVIAKGSYYPVCLNTKMKGISMKMEEITFGITEEQVTFNRDKFPGVPIIDKSK